MIIAPPPPKLEDHKAGTTLVAGLGLTTILPDMDFETYSPAGFIWSPSTNKFGKPKGATKKGLPAIGAAKYSEHPDAEVICLAYDLKNGEGRRLWIPNESNSCQVRPLLNYISNGGLIEAWNVPFEYWIWTNVCVPKYGFPPLDIKQLRCAAAKSRAHALPGSLEPAGNVVGIEHKKDKEGRRLINKFSIPRNPTKHNASLRTLPSDDPEDIQSFYNYCLRDIQAESELSSLIPDLSPEELEFWQCDFNINVRGVAIDLPLINKCKAILEQAYAKYDCELKEITGGMVQAASELPSLKQWLDIRSYPMPSLTEETLGEALANPLLPSDVRRALEIREMIGSASVKKLYSMSNQVTNDGRLHDLFMYHAARTGRASGNGPQPQNLPNSGPMVSECGSCKKHCNKDYSGCPWCGEKTHKTVEWNPQAVADAIEILSIGSLPLVEYYFGDAVYIISACLRGMFISSPNKDLICSDYSAIEAVVLAALAREQWRLDVFNTHGKIYEMSASKITGVDFEEYELYKGTTGSHHPDRKLGKVAELACFPHDTKILTNRGYVDIMDVTLFDKLWDGKEWVKHEGVVAKGKREIILLDGIKVTPNHPISLGHSWKEAKLLVSDENMLTQALEIASENLPTSENMEDQKKVIVWQNVSAHAVNLLIRLILILGPEDQDDAISALRRQVKPQILNGLKHTKATDILYQILNIDDDWEAVYLQLLAVVTMSKTLHTKITEQEALKFSMLGAEKSMIFLRTLLQFQDGITRCLKWIESIVMGIMSLETSNSLLEQITNLINEKYKNYKKESNTSRTVYDIVNAGPRHKFTIKTNSGHLIVHNSGYQGWVGAWKAFGAEELMGSEEAIKNAVSNWRKASPNIVNFWHGIEEAAIAAVYSPGVEHTYNGITYICKKDVLYCRLLSGRLITYHRPLISPNDWGNNSLSFEGWNTNPKYGRTGWVRMQTYGGKLTENIVQATARDLLAYAIVNLEKSGYAVVLHVHDEIVVEVHEGHGSVDEVEKIMSTMPEWAKGWPIKAKDGWRAKRYNK
jgi:DNA polymerase